MAPTSEVQNESSRSEARRAQILAAARACFRRQGFHGASIAQICKKAGMSAGHIYHYFENKEAIIAAIVEQDLDRLLAMTAELRAARDIVPALSACAADGLRDNLDPDSAALKLEIVAEAARNPRVAEIVRAADRRCRAAVIATLREHRRVFGLDDDEAWLEAMAELFATMYDGLLVRAIRNPEISHEALTVLFRKIILDLTVSPAPPGVGSVQDGRAALADAAD